MLVFFQILQTWPLHEYTGCAVAALTWHIITTCTYPLPGNRCFYYNAPTQIKYTHQIAVTHITAVRRTNDHQPKYDP